MTEINTTGAIPTEALRLIGGQHAELAAAEIAITDLSVDDAAEMGLNMIVPGSDGGYISYNNIL